MAPHPSRLYMYAKLFRTLRWHSFSISPPCVLIIDPHMLEQYTFYIGNNSCAVVSILEMIKRTPAVLKENPLDFLDDIDESSDESDAGSDH